MKKLTSLLIVICVLSMNNVVACPREELPDVNKVTIGASNIAKGKTYTSDIGDIFGIYANPAAIGSIKGLELTTMYSNYLSNYQYYVLGGTIPYNNFVIGLGYSGYSMDGIPETDFSAEENRIFKTGTSFSSGERSFMISLATALNETILRRVYLGAGLKVINQFVDGNQRFGYGVNGGLIIPRFVFDDLDVGLVGFNIIKSKLKWTGSNEEEVVESRYRFGASYSIAPSWKIFGDFEKDKNYFGTSYTFIDKYLLKAGIADKSYMLGMGINFDKLSGFDFDNVVLDYAFEYNDDLSALPGAAYNHYFSVSFYHGGESFRPTLDTNKPYIITDEPFYTLSGRAQDNATISIYRNEVLVDRVSADDFGKWEAQIPLDNGNNILYARAQEKNKNISQTTSKLIIRKK
ncbi:MAG TPA: hypothetical protein DF296_07955 [Candidatus Margulisbacteria bacterium]|nr:MAG: hypothetical protein A2X43_12480 [Candidatus Margulisbacteria bacterium GWD2_39_127]OGI04232.1 MAG: hypothetical protein A2X42_05545 [Candidatus Margulisbacteria bacterium GWF2_38_17]OGI07705.1 MAG: hypothetical protein A2X41_04720 [Candidatus Margulisbacteria bacterium GWE2_39_32]HAR62662.1 hypothetical protein [Candidatus Margulisiibacteriota bacterium]HCT85120.1 hypothetical protein [Candidatus Margulisiibacteriota bacterium]